MYKSKRNKKRTGLRHPVARAFILRSLPVGETCEKFAENILARPPTRASHERSISAVTACDNITANVIDDGIILMSGLKKKKKLKMISGRRTLRMGY